jgi:methylglutaconyl-CoA hydratase
MAEYKTIVLDASPGGVATILLNRPDQHNAFNAQMVSELSDAFTTLEAADHVRCLLLRGAGKSFSAGADMVWMKAAADYTREENEEDALALAEMLRKLHGLPMMTMALVHGAAMGGGAGLVAACDLAVAQTGANFRFSEVRLGLTPATISPFVIEAIGPRWAKALFVTAESFDADFAHRIGLVQYVAQDAMEMDKLVDHLAGLAFSTAPGAVRDAKALVDDVKGHNMGHDLSRMTASRIAARRVSAEGREGLAAFLERRKPSWVND